MIIHGDCIEKLKLMDGDSVDAVVTDPPYGLSFMGKKWDYDVPSVDVWIECLRVLKPGGHLLSFGGTRTYHRMVVNMEDAGFEIRDQVQWLYGSGFPKSHNIGNGIGTALKPANEPICLARKPISEKTVAANVLKYGTGGLNIDATRIPGPPTTHGGMRTDGAWVTNKARVDTYVESAQGRWPANLILDEIAAAMLDEQSGNSKPTGGASRFFYVAKASKKERNAGLEFVDKPLTKHDARPADWENADWKSRGGNHHPTVKPIKLMEYLCKLICPPGGVILDPFMGSGSTGVAAKNLGFQFVGIDQNEEYVEIANRRIG